MANFFKSETFDLTTDTLTTVLSIATSAVAIVRSVQASHDTASNVDVDLYIGGNSKDAMVFDYGNDRFTYNSQIRMADDVPIYFGNDDDGFILFTTTYDSLGFVTTTKDIVIGDGSGSGPIFWYENSTPKIVINSGLYADMYIDFNVATRGITLLANTDVGLIINDNSGSPTTSLRTASDIYIGQTDDANYTRVVNNAWNMKTEAIYFNDAQKDVDLVVLKYNESVRTEALRFDAGNDLFTFSSPVVISGATTYLKIPVLTSTEKGNLSASNGMIVYDSTLNKFQGFENGSWTSFI